MQTTETHHALVLDPDGLAVPHLAVFSGVERSKTGVQVSGMRTE